MSGLHLPALGDPREDARGAFQTCNRLSPGSGIAITSARRYLMFFNAAAANTLTALDIFTGAGVITTVTACRLGLYTVAANGDCSLAAQTTNDATRCAVASTEYGLAASPLDTTGGFPASYTLVRGARYAAAFYVTASATPTIFGVATNTLLTGASPRLTGFDNSGSGTDLNLTITAANIANIASMYYLAGL